MKYYLYIIICDDKYLYTGITNDLSKRISEHRNGKCPLTKNRDNIKLVYKEGFSTRIEAAKREKEIKGWRRSKKEQLFNK